MSCNIKYEAGTDKMCYKDAEGVIHQGEVTTTLKEDGGLDTQVFTDDMGREIPKPDAIVSCKAFTQQQLDMGCCPDNIQLLKDIKLAIESQKDYEVLSTGWMCGENDTWVRTVTTYEDGEEKDKVEVDSGIPCSKALPIDPEVFTSQVCINGFAGTQAYVIVFDADGKPSGPEKLGDPIMTTKRCTNDIVSVDVELECGDGDTFATQVVTTIINGRVSSVKNTRTDIRCADRTNVTQVRVCDGATGTVHIITTAETTTHAGDTTLTLLDDTDTGEVCTPPVKQEVDVEECDGTVGVKPVDQTVHIENNFIRTRPVDVADVVTQRTYADGCAEVVIEKTVKTDCAGVETATYEVISSNSVNFSVGDMPTQAAVDLLPVISPDRKTKVTVGGSALVSAGQHVFPTGACGLVATNLGGSVAHFNGHPIEAGEQVPVGQERIGASYTIDAYQQGVLAGTYETDGKLKIQFLFCSDIKCIGPVFDNSLKVGKASTVDTKGQDNVCEGQDITYSLSNAVNCTVVNNNDGTWDVTPSVDACGDSWSFDRTLTCADETVNTAPVSGNVASNVKTFPIHFDMSTGATAKLRVVLTSSAGKYDVDWGDGTTDLDNNSNALVTHTYGTNFNGNVVVKYLSCFDVRDINTNGNVDAVAGDEPAGILKLSYGTVNTASGDVGSFKKSIQKLYASNNNTIGGDIINTSEDLVDLRISGKNTIGGDIGTAHEGLAIISLTGLNTLYGDANTMPSTITSFSVTGLNTIGGTTQDIDQNRVLTYFNLQGQNTLSGDVANFKSPVLTTLAVKGGNILDGIINDIQSDVLRDLIIAGNTTVGGTFGTDLDGVTVPDLSPVLRRLELAGDSTFGGTNGADVALMPPSLQELRLDSTSSYLVGDLNNSGSSGIKVLRAINADLTGQLDLIPWANCVYFVITGSSTITAPNAIWTFSTTFSEFKYRSDQPLSQEEVDNILKACESVTTWTGYKRVEINGSGASSPSPAGLASKAILEAQGVTVVVN